MTSKTIIAASLGLLLIAGSAMAERRLTINPRTGPNEDAPRESVTAPTQGSANQNFTKPVHLNGVMRASRGRGITVAGETVLLGANCGIFPSPDPDRLPNPSSWNGRTVTVFGYRTRAGVDARLLILQGSSDNPGIRRNQSNQEVIPSVSDPSVGVVRRGAPG